MPITLLDLPVLPPDRDTACGTSIIQETYLQERDAIKTVEELEAHLKRWENLFLLEPEPEVEFPLKDLEKTLALLLQCRENVETELNFDTIEAKEVACIMIPAALMRAFLLAQHYIVGHDLAMVRLYLDPYPELIDELRGQCYGGCAKRENSCST